MAMLLESDLRILGLAADYNDNARRSVESILDPDRVDHSIVSVANYKLFLHYTIAHPRSWSPMRSVLWQMHKVRSKL
jgi:hypothetical protein